MITMRHLILIFILLSSYAIFAQNIGLPAAKNAINNEVDVQFYDNGTTIKINLGIPINIKQIEVYDILSNLVYLKQINSRLIEYTLHIGTMPDGIYFVRLHYVINDQEYFLIKKLYKCFNRQ